MKSIRSIVFFSLFILISTFFLILTGVSYFLIQNVIPQFVVEDSSTSLTYIVENIRENYYGQLSGLDTIANAPAFTDYSRRDAEQLAKNFLHFGNTFQTVHAYKNTGELLFATKRQDFPDYQPEKSFYMHRDSFFVELAKRVIETRKAETSQVLYTSHKHRPYQVYVVPILSKTKDGPISGILSGAVFLPLPRFDALINGLALSRNNFLIVSDINGKVIMSNGLEESSENPFLKRHLEHSFDHLEDAKINGAKEELVEHHGPDFNFPFILVSQKFREADLLVTLGVNTAAIELRKSQLIQYLLIGYTVCLFLLLGLSVILSRRISRPLDEISNTIRQLSLGNFSYRVENPKADELGHMGNLVNKLAEKMEKDRYLGYLWGTEDEVDEILKGRD